jgi:hypothetical protein
MTYLGPASGHHGSNVRRRCAPTGRAGTSGADLGVRPSSSDATRMVGGVLLLVPATMILVLGDGVGGWPKRRHDRYGNHFRHRGC